MHRRIEVHWRKGTAAGYTDVFPIEQFAREVANAERLHKVRGPKQGNHHARFKLSVSARTATLDYRAFADFNTRHQMELGVMSFEFEDSNRTDVKVLRWNQVVVDKTEAVASTIDSEDFAAAGEAIAQQQRVFAEQMVRPGQAEFRERLDLVYGAQCCVTGCPVPYALQAAHILPFAEDARSNAPTNGLLLRADLHVLFDSNQMAIQPTTFVVFFAPEATVWPEYSRLNGRCKLREPQPGFSRDAPTPQSLKLRWKNFVKANGAPNDTA